jgi:hypothetical protein
MWLKLIPDDAAVQFQWGSNDGPFDPYPVGKGTLEASTANARQALKSLVEAAGEEGRDFGEELRALARAGADLYFNIFPGARNPVAKRVRQWLRQQADTKLRITTHESIHVPWSLLFDGDVDSIAGRGSSVDEYPEFWGVKYGLSCTTSGYNESESTLVRKRDAARMLNLVDAGVAERAMRNLSEQSREQYRSLMNHPVGVSDNVGACKRLIGQAATFDTIFHFFGHHHDGRLKVGDAPQDTISVEDFGRLLEALCDSDDDGKSYGLVLLNACESAYGHMDYSFSQAANRPGLCGLVGTEAIIPRDFAARFAIEFLTKLLSGGESIGEALCDLRKDPDFWPLSLSYGCYAQPDYRFRVS